MQRCQHGPTFIDFYFTHSNKGWTDPSVLTLKKYMHICMCTFKQWTNKHLIRRNPISGNRFNRCRLLTESYFWMAVWRVSTLLWQRSRVRLVMFTLMESMHTLSAGWGGGDVTRRQMTQKTGRTLEIAMQCILAAISFLNSPILWASSNTTTELLASSLDTRSAIFGSSR